MHHWQSELGFRTRSKGQREVHATIGLVALRLQTESTKGFLVRNQERTGIAALRSMSVLSRHFFVPGLDERLPGLKLALDC